MRLLPQRRSAPRAFRTVPIRHASPVRRTAGRVSPLYCPLRALWRHPFTSASLRVVPFNTCASALFAICLSYLMRRRPLRLRRSEFIFAVFPFCALTQLRVLVPRSALSFGRLASSRRSPEGECGTGGHSTDRVHTVGIRSPAAPGSIGVAPDRTGAERPYPADARHDASVSVLAQDAKS